MKEKQTLLRAIGAYVPDFVVRQVMAEPEVPMAGREERLQAALLFADVSGFTAMSEGLAELGKEGAEELTRVLNDYFTTMIDLVREYGGQVIKFGGDAITCAFPSLRGDETEGENLRAAILQASECALAMQEKMAVFQAVETRGGVFELQMKIGVSAGTVISLSVGDSQEGLEYVLAGRPLDRMAEAEHHAQAGEVVVDGECLPEDIRSWNELSIIVGEERDGFLLVKGSTEEAEDLVSRFTSYVSRFTPHVPHLEEHTEQIITQLVPYLPSTVHEQIVEGQRQFVGGHRWVVSLFVNFLGLDYDNDPKVGEKLQRYFSAMQRIVHRHGGRLNRVITGDKGSLLHIIFGAPVAHEDNEERAVGCALAMQRRAIESDKLPFIVDQRIGVASGYVFAGNVGSERRREYTVMGDVVNLSARLMQAAGEGEILIDRQTALQVEETFAYEELPPIQVKGKREPIPICKPLGTREGAKMWEGGWRRETPLVGRERELAQIEGIVGRASAGQGQLLIISGEAGVGKSRFLEDVVALAREKVKGTRVLGGNCLSYGSQSPYLPWIELLNDFFGLSEQEGGPPQQRMRIIEQRMREVDPALAGWAPLMGQLLGLPAPDNELTAALDAQLRKQRTFDITLNLLRHQARQVPLLLIIFEDVHWIDAISLEMLNYVARNVVGYPILLIALRRPTIELTEWERYDHLNRIELTDLPAEDALKLVQFKLGIEEVPAPLQDRILRGEARVNPFFAEEVVNSLVDRGYLVPRDGEGYELVADLAQVEIPDTIQTLVMSRIDRLDESSKLTVKVASVIGRTFKYRSLAGIYPVEVTPEKLSLNLERLNKLDLTPLDRPAPEWEYIFRHVTTQEVAYESLLYAHRRELHHRMGEYLEANHASSLEEAYDLLAHHYYQSGDERKSWQYLLKAGDRAKERYANQAAIAYYERALSLDLDIEETGGHGVLPLRARPAYPFYHVHASLGDVYRLIGEYDRAVDNYRQALDCHPEAAQIAETRRKIAKTWELQGRYDKAMRYLELTRSALGREERTPEMARIYNDMGWIAKQRGDYKEALRLCAEGLGVIEGLTGELDDVEKTSQVEAELQHTLGTVYWGMGDYVQAIDHFQECIDRRESIGDLHGASRSYNNLAAVYWSQSDYDAAARQIRRSLEISQKIGHAYGTAMCYNNLGVISYTQGDYPRALEYYEKSLEIRREIGDLKGIADVYGNLGEIHHSLGNHRQALQYLQEAVELFKGIGDKRALCSDYKLLADVELALGDTAEALEYCQRSLELAQEIGNREYEGIAYRVLGQIDRAEGRLEEAREHLQSSVEILSAAGNKLELGKSNYELGITLAAMNLGGEKQLQEAVHIFEELDVEGELEKARAALESL